MSDEKLRALETLASKQSELALKQFEVITSLVDRIRALEAVSTALVIGLPPGRREAIRVAAGSMFVDLEGAEHIAGLVDDLTRGFAGFDPAEVHVSVQ